VGAADGFVDRYEKDFSVVGAVEEVASAAVFPASDDVGFVNGHALPIDNGGVAG
jgi:NAD(P)-dependent dehydrogenase (short-subunit alcohol dehydrogenase family)